MSVQAKPTILYSQGVVHRLACCEALKFRSLSIGWYAAYPSQMNLDNTRRVGCCTPPSDTQTPPWDIVGTWPLGYSELLHEIIDRAGSMV